MKKLLQALVGGILAALLIAITGYTAYNIPITVTLSGAVTGTATNPTNIAITTALAQAAANTVKGNPTGATANEQDVSLPSCPPSGGNALAWTSGTGFACNSIPADTIVRTSITGFLPTAISGTSTTAAVTISSGQAADSTAAAYLSTSGNTAWAVANGNAINGYAGGTTLPNSSTIHFFICSGTSGTGTFASTSLTPVFPTGYTTYSRRIFDLLTNGSGALLGVTAQEVGGGAVQMIYSAPNVADFNAAPPTSRVSEALAVPTGVQVGALFRATLTTASNNPCVILTNLSEPDQTPFINGPASLNGLTATSGNEVSGTFNIMTNTSGQIGIRSSTTSATLYIQTYGWIDARRN